ncbi:MAG: Fur family transcriptional regulator [Alphaproteobacteria bacterium]|nr:Fur family transcriptional regulator [Alphaproteobacteria bacterium]
MPPRQKPKTLFDIKIERHLKACGGRMTSVRRDVLNKMMTIKKPQTAYQLLSAVNKKRKSPLSAISLYRALNFLIEAGVVLKIESQNTFWLCGSAAPHHNHVVTVCNTCGRVEEIDAHALTALLKQTAKKHGHTLKHPVIELHGTCKNC